MSKLTWQRLATGDLLCMEYPIRLEKPISRRPDDPGWTIRVPGVADSTYADTDGWQWHHVLDQGSHLLQENTARDAKALVESTVYQEYILGWIPSEYLIWTDDVRKVFADAAQVTADKFAAIRAQYRGTAPAPAKRRTKAAPDPYEAIGVRRPNANGWPVLLELSSVQFAALLKISGKVAEGDIGEHAQQLREIHQALINIDPRGGRT